MKIELTQNKFALVDDEDYRWLNEFKWYRVKSKKTDYAYTKIIQSNGKRKSMLMHRLILNTPTGMQTDHKNHNGLDNRKSNIRICTSSENHQNMIPNRKSKYFELNNYKGVHKNKGYYTAKIQLNGKGIHLGSYKTPKEAATRYNREAIILFGEFALLNELGCESPVIRV